ncbi:MAG: SRPBCC family protein [Saprospiraceae bacterium]
MVDVLTEIQINRPLEVVSSYAADPINVPAWYENINYAHRLPEGTTSPLEVGSLIQFKAAFLGKSLDYTYIITERSFNKLVMKTNEGPFPMETIYEWKKIDDQTTHMTLRNRGNPTGFLSLLAPFMSMAMKRANRKDLQKLKSILETP